MISICRYSGLGCALCLRDYAAWEREHAAELEPYYVTEKDGERSLSPFYCEEPLCQSMPKCRPAATIAPIHVDGTTVAIAVCYEHLASTATE